MRTHRTLLTAIAAALALPLGTALAADAPAAPQGVNIVSPLKLDAVRLMAMKTGDQVAIDFPVIGRKTVVFETTTRGIDGQAYWHGRLVGDARDRVFLKQTSSGFVGAIRFADRQVAFAQQGSGLRAVDASALAAVAGQAYAVGPALEKGVHEIHSNFAAIAQAGEGAEIALPLPGGLTEVAVVTRSAIDEQGFQQVTGVSRMDGIAYPTQLTISKDAVFGTVLTANGEYQIVTRGGKTQILDPKAAGWQAPRGDDHVAAPDLDFDALVAAATARPGTSTTPLAATVTTTPVTTSLLPLKPGTVDTTINLLMTYSASYVTMWGNETAARTRLSNLVEVANSAYGNSGTGVKFRIVGWRQVAVADATPQTHLGNMRTDAGAFKGTAAQKALNGAAMTVFFSPFNAVTSTTGTCGLAYVPAANAAGLASYKVQAPSLMFAALNDGQTSNGWYCESLTLAHELGHNLGNAHDKANSSFPGVFTSSYGKGVSGSFGTVMSYISPRVALFSSPQLKCTTAGAACGTATENVVATLLQTKSTVAALGKATATTVAADGSFMVSGWLLNTNGTPFTGAATFKVTTAGASCVSGRTGLYTCRVPAGVNAVTLSAAVAGRAVTPTLSTFSVNRMANTPVNATRFYVK
jgi:Metallo-peptidase family M12B Reprolysin-like